MTADLESLVRLLKADGGMSWPSNDGCTCSACRLKRQIDVELDRLAAETSREPLQDRVLAWARKCFWRPDALEPPQRSFRFIEEALELVQAVGTSREDVLRLVDYVYERPIGKPEQEVGGVMVTLSALTSSLGKDLNECAEAELARCITNIERIREKDMRKPARSSLPGSSEKTSVTTGEKDNGNEG